MVKAPTTLVLSNPVQFSFPAAAAIGGSYYVGGVLGSSMVGIGLTGGIATGKSTVSNFLRESGPVIVDADVVAREVVLPGRASYNAIVRTFGEGVLNEDRTLNRAKLGAIIFSDPAKRKSLNACTHVRGSDAVALYLLYILSSCTTMPSEIHHLGDVQAARVLPLDRAPASRCIGCAFAV